MCKTKLVIPSTQTNFLPQHILFLCGMLCQTEQCGISLTVHTTGIELYTSFMTFKNSLLFSGLQYMIDIFATVMHVPQIVCLCYSTVDIGKCKQHVTERLLHIITIKFCMKCLFPGYIIILYNHNHMTQSVKFSWWGALGGWRSVAPAALLAVCVQPC
jgi:hypothetical protein